MAPMQDTRLSELLEKLRVADPVAATDMAEELSELLAALLEESGDL